MRLSPWSWSQPILMIFYCVFLIYHLFMAVILKRGKEKWKKKAHIRKCHHTGRSVPSPCQLKSSTVVYMRTLWLEVFTSHGTSFLSYYENEMIKILRCSSDIEFKLAQPNCTCQFESSYITELQFRTIYFSPGKKLTLFFTWSWIRYWGREMRHLFKFDEEVCIPRRNFREARPGNSKG